MYDVAIYLTFSLLDGPDIIHARQVAVIYDQSLHTAVQQYPRYWVSARLYVLYTSPVAIAIYSYIIIRAMSSYRI